MEIAREALDNQDYTTALMFLEKPAKDGSAVAQMLLGYLLINGLGAEADESAGEAWLRKAAVQGQPDAMFFLGMVLVRKAPNMAKGDSWKAHRDWLGSCKPRESELWMENAALMGQPSALRMNCFSKSDEGGPPSAWPVGYAWCKIAVEQNIYGTSEQIDIAKTNLANVTERLSKADRKIGEFHAKSILSRMESYKFDYAEVEKRLKDCKAMKQSAKKSVKPLRDEKEKSQTTFEDKEEIEKIAALVKQAGVLGEAKKHDEMLKKLKEINHPLKNNLIGLVSRGCIENDKPEVGLKIAESIEDADLKSRLQILAHGKLFSLGKEKRAETLLDRLKEMNLESEALAAAAIRALEEGQTDQAVEILKKIEKKEVVYDVKTRIIIAYLDRFDFRKALKMIDVEKDYLHRRMWIMNVAYRYAESGNFKGAIKIAKENSSPYVHPALMVHIVSRLAEAKRSDEALKLLKELSSERNKQNEYYKNIALINIASFST
ncbi:MAG: hypothetical protein GY859_11510 [Desulfobacterales bacterium]|nr:hypothetical protein [Desulfobacterales bacterium]